MDNNVGPGSYVTSTANYYNPSPRRFTKKTIVFGAVGVLVVIILIIVVVALGGRDNLGTDSQHLSARLTNLSTLTTSAIPLLSNGSLESINAETDIITDGVTANLASVLPKRVDKNIALAEADTTDTTALANAALAGTYNSQYQQVLTQKLQDIDALLNEMATKTKSDSLRTTLQTDITNYQALLTNLGKVNL